jgi:hypothetical protein
LLDKEAIEPKIRYLNEYDLNGTITKHIRDKCRIGVEKKINTVQDDLSMS